MVKLAECASPPLCHWSLTISKLHNLESIRRSPPVGWGIKRIQAYFIWAKQVTDSQSDSA